MIAIVLLWLFRVLPLGRREITCTEHRTYKTNWEISNTTTTCALNKLCIRTVLITFTCFMCLSQHLLSKSNVISVKSKFKSKMCWNSINLWWSWLIYKSNKFIAKSQRDNVYRQNEFAIAKYITPPSIVMDVWYRTFPSSG